ncbi:polycomb protein Pcl isoform X2 [Eurosta solidaginis]|uniref:polycomb protein Pcl isoform X2 n=1 Tax=Eurosta solidaginis TaxID=178769 RepID=UPI003531536E
MNNNSPYGVNVHTDNTSVQNHAQPRHSGNPSHNTTMTPTISSFFNPHTSTVPLSAHQQPAQLQLQTIRTCGNSGTDGDTNPSPISASGVSAFYDPKEVQLTSALEKTFYSTAIAGLQSSTPRYYSTVGANVPPSMSTTPVQQVPHQHHHNHQQANTILITNNFAAHQYGAPANHASIASAQIQPGTSTNVVSSGSPTVTTATSGYNNAASNNIRIVTAIPDTIHHHQNPQQHLYNLTKEVDPTNQDDIIQLPQFYHAPHQTSSYTQQLSTILPTHFTQHFAASSGATGQIQITHDDVQSQHQFFMPMANDPVSSAAKILSNTVNEGAAVTDAITTTSTMVSSPAPTTTSNSTLVLDRINICINNHYSDSLATNNSLPPTALDSNAIIANPAIPSAAHAFSSATHAPQQPSPIIPAIHHKLVLDPAASSVIQADSYISNGATLVVDEPDSTTATPHTPPTTPENSSPPPCQTNLTTTRTIATPQAMIAQIITEDKVTNDKEFYVTPQAISIHSIKTLGNQEAYQTETSTAGHALTAITQSIDLLDDDEECDYGNDKGAPTAITPNDANDDSVMEIEDDDVEILTPATVRTKNDTKSCELDTQNTVKDKQGHPGMLESRDDNGSIFTTHSPKSPNITKIVQMCSNETASSVTLLTPTTSPVEETQECSTNKATTESTAAAEFTFSMGEDVFIRKDDDRQYLGTVIGSSAGTERNGINKLQYLIRFDDNSELWCGVDQMRRLGRGSGNGNSHMCVACKRTQLEDVVEICEDCRRGYHRSCTRETLPGSGVWWCIRCNKPMKTPTPNTDSQIIGKLFTSCNNYKSYGDIVKSSPLSSKPKTSLDVYEFHTDNEIFTSDDEIPIKHIIEKARKVRDLAEMNTSNSVRLKSTKKQISSERMMSDKMLDLDDENANDAKSANKVIQMPKKENVKLQDILPNVPSSVVSQCPTNIEDDESGSDHQPPIVAISTVESNITESVYIDKAPSISTERTSRKRKAFTLSNTYKKVAAEAASKQYDSSRICDSSSDENSSSSRGTSLDVIIPAPKNFLGLNNPFRMVTPKKSTPPGISGGCVQSLFSFSRSGTMIKNSIFNTTALDFSSKLAALKSAGIFPNLSTSNLVKAAGQPRTVRTVKRRLSAKDITIGPNQEVRRRRTRRLSSNVEVISTTTFNPIPTNFFPIHAKDLYKHTQLNASNRILPSSSKQQKLKQSTLQNHPTASTCLSSLSASSASSSPPRSVASSVNLHAEVVPIIKPSHGRRLRQRPQKNSVANSRRSSISSASTASSNNSSSNITLATLQQQQALHKNNNPSQNNINTDGTSIQNLKQSVKEYFGGVLNRIESGEHFCIRAKRQLANAQTQYLIEWGDANVVSNQNSTLSVTTTPQPPLSTPATLKDDDQITQPISD